MDIDEFTEEEKESQGLCGSTLHMNSLEVIIHFLLKLLIFWFQLFYSFLFQNGLYQGACNADGSRVVDWGGLIIMFMGVALTGKFRIQ